ncbi:MAG: response regulator transcription factor [Caldilineaceae bacterium]|nr:response regulator transcription factor [Caldilineaceae bacterium]
MIRVQLVDDDERVRRGWQMRLALEPEIEVVGMAGELAAAVVMAAVTQPHVILLDIKLPDISGISGMEQLRRAAPRCAIIIVTVYDSAANREQALHAGADAFLSKQANFDQLLALIGDLGAAVISAQSGGAQRTDR